MRACCTACIATAYSQQVPLIAAETEGAASFAAAIDAGVPVTLPAMTSIAGSLGA